VLKQIVGIIAVFFFLYFLVYQAPGSLIKTDMDNNLVGIGIFVFAASMLTYFMRRKKR
jgi:hypothetical protein